MTLLRWTLLFLMRIILLFIYRLTNPTSLGTCFNQGFHLQAADGLYTVQLITVQGTFNQKLILQH
jgi:hypothetical protein